MFIKGTSLSQVLIVKGLVYYTVIYPHRIKVIHKETTAGRSSEE